MKVRFREPTNEGLGLKKSEARAKKLDTARQKYKKVSRALIGSVIVNILFATYIIINNF